MMQLSDLKRSIAQMLSPDWWIRIETKVPDCVYYFGPFDHQEEAKASKNGYIDDLIQEGAEEITIHLERGSPQVLTIYDQS